MLKKRAPQKQPEGYKLIRLNDTLFSIVDPDDYEWLIQYHWRPKRNKKHFYAVHRVTRFGHTTETLMHRLIMNPRPDEEPHHINHDTLDNRKCNLVNVDHSQHRRLSDSLIY